MEQTWSKLLDDAEVWDGMAPAWMAAGKMPGGTRAGHTMTTLANGREVLVVGGGRSDRALSEVDLFDAAYGGWSAAAPLNVARARHKALLLVDGRVLVVGGGTYPRNAGVLPSTELFDPTTSQWTSAAPMRDARADFDIALLPDGRVLVAGGTNNSADGNLGALSSAEVYDPAADTWTSLPEMNERRLWPVLTVLSDGVYVAGGMNTCAVLASVEHLAWSELGIAGPVHRDAGVPDASPPDAAATCGSPDARVGRDSAPDAGAPPDGAVDASQSDGPTDTPVGDAGSSDRGTGGGQSGCSCGVGEPRDASLASIALACAALAAVRRRRPRRAS
jgi:hypothetical protein